MLAHGSTIAERLISICSAGALDGSLWSLVGGLAVVGLVGSGLHCTPMCGPIVLAQGVQRGTHKDGALSRIAVGALLPYHLGRLTTYAALGAVSGGFGGAIIALSGFRWVAATLLLIAALLLINQALKTLGAPHLLPASVQRPMARLGLPLVRRIGAVNVRMVGLPDSLQRYLLGLLLGFLPCGLLYGALFAAASSGSVIAGALIMAAFAGGTVPALSVLAATGHVAARHWPIALRRVSGIALALGAGLSAAFAFDWMS